jgi:hypothetical protein
VTAYPLEVVAIQFVVNPDDGTTNFTDVQQYLSDNSGLSGNNLTTWRGWSVTDNGDGTMRLAAPAPRKPITLNDGDWLFYGYNTIPNVLNNDPFTTFFGTGA